MLVLMVGETGVPGENQCKPVQTVSFTSQCLYCYEAVVATDNDILFS
jgi:hypothetical protein